MFEFLDSSWEKCASNDETRSLICLFLLRLQLSCSFNSLILRIVSLPAENICYFSYASLHYMHSWLLRSGLSPKPEIMIAIACLSTLFQTAFSFNAVTNFRLLNASLIPRHQILKLSSCTPLNFGSLASYLSARKLNIVSLMFPGR